jgi:hypothetical protein
MYVERTGMSFDNPSAVKLIKSVRPRVDASIGTTLTVQVGSSMTPDGAITYGASNQFVVGTSHKVDMLGPVASGGSVAGRFLAVKINGGIGSSRPAWRCRSLDIEYEVVGYE